MKDEIISFETAKLAKEKGFNFKCPKYYTTENPHSYNKDLNGMCILGLMHSNSLYEPLDEIDKETGLSIYRLNPGIVYAPTQSLLQKWLREEHNMHVCADLTVHNSKVVSWYVRVDDIKKNDYVYHSEDNDIKFESYEQALEAGLQEALKLIKT